MNKNEIRLYNNTIIIEFEKCGDGFSLNVPHYKKWISIINFLRKRGFKVGENEYYKEHYACLSKYNKIGFKNNVACLMEIGAKRIEIEFGHIKNLWKNMPQDFWSDKNDERYTKLTYLEEKSVELEIYKLSGFIKKWGFEFENRNVKLAPEEYIINNLKNNAHIHGNIEKLEDIKNDITEDSYDYKHNSNDKNGNKIICGDTKYYYDRRTKRLSKGVAWHHINNMWWVISGGELHNVASFDLFGFDKSLPNRKLSDARKIKDILNNFSDKMQFERCIGIRNYAKRNNINLD